MAEVIFITDTVEISVDNKRYIVPGPVADKIAKMEADIIISDALINERNRILNLLPCPDHGQCVPRAIEEIKRLQSVIDKTAEFINQYHREKYCWDGKMVIELIEDIIEQRPNTLKTKEHEEEDTPAHREKDDLERNLGKLIAEREQIYMSHQPKRQ